MQGLFSIAALTSLTFILKACYTPLMNIRISSQLLLEEAENRGWQTTILNEAEDLIELIAPGHSPMYLRYSTTELSTAIGFRIATDKYSTFMVLSKYGLPLPATIQHTDLETSLAFTKEHGSVVVKPANGHQGVGITTGVKTEQELRSAIETVNKDYERAVIQNQISGQEYRFFVVNGRVRAVANRRPAFVIGDGQRTVAELIEDENRRPERAARAKTVLKPIDIESAKLYLNEKIMSVPKSGEEFQVIATSNISRGGESVDSTEIAHVDIKNLAEKAATILGLGVCGVDIMCRDVEKSAAEAKAYILEVEENPGLRVHHFPSRGRPRNVAGEILDGILEKRAG